MPIGSSPGFVQFVVLLSDCRRHSLLFGAMPGLLHHSGDSFSYFFVGTLVADVQNGCPFK